MSEKSLPFAWQARLYRPPPFGWVLLSLSLAVGLFLLDSQAPAISWKPVILLMGSLYLTLFLLWTLIHSGFHGWIHFQKSQTPVSAIRQRQRRQAKWHFLHTSVILASLFFLISSLLSGMNKEPAWLHSAWFLSFLASLMSLHKIQKWGRIVDITPGRLVFLTYGVVALFSAFLLVIPFSLQPGKSVSLIDALFVSVSALAVTGLTPINIATDFSLTGQSIILILIQLGGLGIIVLSLTLSILVSSRLSLSHSLMGRTLYDLPSYGGFSRFILKVILFTLIMEIIGTFLIYFFLPPDLPHRFFHAIFHSISAFCNAGFSSFESNLNIPGLAGVKSLVCLLVLLGGIGFPVLFEVSSKIFPHKRKKPWTPHTVLTLWTNGFLFIVGGAVLFLIESTLTGGFVHGFFSDLGDAFFYSISTRTAGFNLTPVDQMQHNTQLFMIFLMIIGGSPLSTAGGIKTTTAAVILIAAFSMLRGHRWIQFRRSELAPYLLQKCVTIIVLYAMTFLVALMFLLSWESIDPWSLTFEVISALSTVGLSLGATPQLSDLSKFVVIGLMLAGRLGLVTMVYIGMGKVSEQRFHYAQRQFFVG